MVTGLVDDGAYIGLLAVDIVVVFIKDTPDAGLYVLLEEYTPPAACWPNALFPSGYLAVIIIAPAAHYGFRVSG